MEVPRQCFGALNWPEQRYTGLGKYEPQGLVLFALYISRLKKSRLADADLPRLFRNGEDRKPDFPDPWILQNLESALNNGITTVRRTMKTLTSFPDALLNAAHRSLVVALPI